MRARRITLAALTLAITAACAMVAPVRAADVPLSNDGPVTYEDTVRALRPEGYWKLDERSGFRAYDSSGKGRHGVYRGSVLLNQAPLIREGRSTNFNEGSFEHVEVPDKNAWSITTTGYLSVVTWLAADRLDFITAQAPSGDPYINWLGKGDINPGKHEWMLRLHNLHSGRPQRLSAYVHPPSGGLGNGAYVQEPFERGERIMFVATYSIPDDRIRVYKNGVLRQERGLSNTTVSLTPQNGSAPLRIGTFNRSSFFDGDIDEVSIHGTELTPGDVAALYSAGADPSP